MRILDSYYRRDKMPIQVRNAFIWIITCFFTLSSYTYASEILKSETEQLRRIDRIAGSFVGRGSGSGAFFNLSKIFLQKGKEEEFLKLTTDENPVVRSMGLLCLAQNKKSIQVLKEHLSDQDIIEYQPLGCIISRTTIGQFTRNLLHNANHLEFNSPSLPVLSTKKMVGLDIEILAKDSTSNIHDDSRKALSNAFAEWKTSLTLSKLIEYAPDLETYQIIKAIGRLELCPDHRRFLIYVARNKDFDDKSRLAAFSALTRSKNEHLFILFERETDYLNSIEGGNWGDHFLDTFQNRVFYEKLIRPNPEEFKRLHTEEMKDEALRAFSNSHPLTLPDLRNRFIIRIALNDENGRKAVKKWLIDMSKKLEKYNQPWNTYSDTPYVLRSIVESLKEDRDFKQMFTEAERLELEKNIQNAIRNHFEEK
jgi:hypothetical protein